MKNSMIISDNNKECSIETKDLDTGSRKTYLTKTSIILVAVSSALLIGIIAILVGLRRYNKRNHTMKRTDIDFASSAHLEGVERCVYEKEIGPKEKASLIFTNKTDAYS